MFILSISLFSLCIAVGNADNKVTVGVHPMCDSDYKKVIFMQAAIYTTGTHSSNCTGGCKLTEERPQGDRTIIIKYDCYDHSGQLCVTLTWGVEDYKNLQVHLKPGRAYVKIGYAQETVQAYPCPDHEFLPGHG